MNHQSVNRNTFLWRYYVASESRAHCGRVLKSERGWLRPQRRRISPTYRVEFSRSRSRRQTSQAVAEFFSRRRRRI